MTARLFKTTDTIKYKGKYYIAYNNSVGFEPDKNPHHWLEVSKEIVRDKIDWVEVKENDFRVDN